MIWVTGYRGFLGQHVTAKLTRPWIGISRRDWNLVTHRPVFGEGDRVLHLAYPGSKFGIETSVKSPFSLAADLLRMDANVIEACGTHGVAKLVCCGSVCAYPEQTTLPTGEDQLWNGYPEPVNAAYGMAKRMQWVLLQAARQQYGLKGIHLILANMYGPGDRSGHVIPSLIRKIRQAKVDGGPVVGWGRPEVTRAFLYVEDAAEGIVRALEEYDSPEPLNLCHHQEVSMEALVQHLALLLEYQGEVEFDTTKPTGHLRRQFDTSRLQEVLGWRPPTLLWEGLQKTVAWHLAHEGVPA